MLDLIFFCTAISLIPFGSMIFFVDLFQPHGIDVQAGEQKSLALAYSTLYNMVMTWLQHLLALAMQEHHVVIIIPSGLATTHTSFLLWILMDSWILQNKAIFVPSCIFLLESPRQNYYQNSCKLSDPYIYQYIVCQILSFSEYIQKYFQDLLLAKQSSRLLVILFQYFLDQVC